MDAKQEKIRFEENKTHLALTFISNLDTKNTFVFYFTPFSSLLKAIFGHHVAQLFCLEMETWLIWYLHAKR